MKAWSKAEKSEAFRLEMHVGLGILLLLFAVSRGEDADCLMEKVNRHGPFLFTCSATRVFGTSDCTCLCSTNADAGAEDTQDGFQNTIMSSMLKKYI